MPWTTALKTLVLLPHGCSREMMKRKARYQVQVMMDQNHIDTEKLVSSLRMPCHHPAGIYNRSPATNVQLIARGVTSFQNSGCCASLVLVFCPNISTLVVLLIGGSRSFTAGCANAELAHGYIQALVSGGANQTVLRPTNCTAQHQNRPTPARTYLPYIL